MLSERPRREHLAFPAHTFSNLQPSSETLLQASKPERISLLHPSQLRTSRPGAALTPRDDVDEKRSWSCRLCHPLQSLLSDLDIPIRLW